jgi:hypothetical protein
MKKLTSLVDIQSVENKVLKLAAMEVYDQSFRAGMKEFDMSMAELGEILIADGTESPHSVSAYIDKYKDWPPEYTEVIEGQVWLELHIISDDGYGVFLLVDMETATEPMRQYVVKQQEE